MTVTDDAQPRIEAYLIKLRRCLRGVNAADVRDIVEELRSHIMDKLAATDRQPAAVDAVLAGLGRPEDLACQYLTDDLLARAEVTRSPLRILQSLFRWGSLSAAGFVVLVGSLTGYFVGIVLWLCAAMKLFHPHTAGVWAIPSGPDDVEISVRLGFGDAPIGGRDVLGWWIVPIGLLVGGGLVILTTRLALWSVQRYRKSMALPRG
jgi:uncharacterized membrane protein